MCAQKKTSNVTDVVHVTLVMIFHQCVLIKKTFSCFWFCIDMIIFLVAVLSALSGVQLISSKITQGELFHCNRW